MVLKQRIQEHQNEVSSREVEINEFQKEILEVEKQSKNVESELVEKLQQVSDKYRETKEALFAEEQRQNNLQVQITDYQATLRDNQYYIGQIEKENQLLRDEVEKIKYKNSKDEYKNFLGGLNTIKKPQPVEPTPTVTFQAPPKSPPAVKRQPQPFAEIQQVSAEPRSVNKSARNTAKKEVIASPPPVREFEPSPQKKKTLSLAERTEQLTQVRISSYNQKLLKSIEKKASNAATKENVI